MLHDFAVTVNAYCSLEPPIYASPFRPLEIRPAIFVLQGLLGKDKHDEKAALLGPCVLSPGKPGPQVSAAPHPQLPIFVLLTE